MTVAAQTQSSARPVVSVIMANFNGAAYLAEAIESVQKQTLREIEIIVSDDASTDDSIDIVSRLMETDPRIRLLRSDRNSGPAAARNRALDVAAGEWIAIMDSDDRIDPARLATLIGFGSTDGADIIADDLVEFYTDSAQPTHALLGSHSWKEPISVDIVDYIELNHLYGPGPQLGYLKPMFRSSLLATPDGHYDEGLRIAEDFDLVLRFLHHGSKMRVYPLPLYFYRKHGHSTSHRLSVPTLRAIGDSNLRFRKQIDTSDRRLAYAVEARGRSIDVALAYEQLLDALKTRRWLRSLSIMLARPRSAALLRLPINVRLHRALPLLVRRKSAAEPADPTAAFSARSVEGEHGSRRALDAAPIERRGALDSTQTASDRGRTDSVAVTVCICTFRRASVLDAVRSVAAQQLPAGATLQILVIDNDDTPSARAMIADYTAATGNTVRYVHAPGRNISIARNAALDAVTTPWLAFLDDDEEAPSAWLGQLLSARYGANAVFGPCIAVYAPTAPGWIRAGDYHSNRIPDRQKPIITGYTSNVIVDMEFILKNGLRFDLKLGRTGGEDTVFFYSLYRSGGILTYVPNAIVSEHVVPSRLNIRWIATRRYRSGQIYAKMFRDLDTVKFRTVAAGAILKVGACACMTCALAVTPSRAMKWMMRGLFHVGGLSFALGAAVHEEYSSAGRKLAHANE